MPAYIASLACGGVALVVFLRLRVRKPSAKATLAKAITSVFFILTLLSASIQSGNPEPVFSALVAAGLVCGLLGDIWLDLKFVYKEDGDFWTYAGFLSFMVGHFFFIAAVITRFGVSGPALGVGLGASVVAVLFIVCTEKIMHLKYGKFKLISAIYGAVLFFMSVFTTLTAFFAGEGINAGALLMGVGGVFFLVSDLILSGTYFGEGKNRPFDIVINHVTYYIAQFAIASSVLLLGTIL